MPTLTPPRRLADLPAGGDLLFRAGEVRTYVTLTKLRDEGDQVVMANARGELSRHPGDLVCCRIFLMGCKYTLAVPPDAVLYDWEMPV